MADESSGTPTAQAPAATPPRADPRLERAGKELQDFINQFTQESDRAAVILIGARLEYLLGELLSRFLLPNTGSTDELLDTDRALGTFSARIHAAHRLGTIDADFARALHILRRLRNMFAHETAGASLDHGPNRDRVRELVTPFIHLTHFTELREYFFKNKADVAGDFFTVSSLLMARLERACVDVERVRHTPCALVPSDWRAAPAPAAET